MDEKGIWVQTLWDPLNEIAKSPMESKEQGIRVVAYCRVSNRKNSFESLINQISYFTNLIKSKPNWKFTGVYFDYGISGATLAQRPGFKRMLRHCDEGSIDLILTKSISRFSRNTKELIEIVNKLREKKIAIYFEKEHIDTSLNYNSFLLNIYGALGQQELENASQLARWGHEKKFMKGIPMFKGLYGYDVDENKGNPIVTINEYEAKVVRWIFDKFINDSSYTDITKELIEKGVRTKKGTYLWKKEYVMKIIKNLSYTGNKIARTKTKDVLTNEIKKDLRDEFYFENSHPAIISKDVYDRAQARVQGLRRENVKDYATYNIRPFSKRIICGYCKEKFNSKPPNSWRCRTTMVSKEFCNAEVLNDKPLKKMFLRAFEQRFDFKSPNILKELFKTIQKVNQNDHFEFHRLKYLTEIEIAYKSSSKNEIDDLIGKYKEFEEKVKKIEEDRIYRDEAVSWSKNIETIEEFKEEITIEYIRAWVKEITVYSKEAYIVHWIDEVETVVGDYEAAKKVAVKTNEIHESSELTLPEIEGNLKIESPTETEKLNLSSSKQSQAIRDGTEKNQEGVECLVTNLNTEVIKINPGRNPIDIIKKRLKKSSFEDVYEGLSQEKKSKKAIRTAAYCRVSTEEEQQLISLKTQIAYYTYTILKDEKYEYAGIYADEGLSGKSMINRTEFNRMIEDCKAGKIDLIITKSISRFSRNTVEALSTIRMLKSLPSPVYCYFEKENINTSDEKSEVVLSLYLSLGQEEVSNISHNVSWGIRKLAQRGIIHRTTDIYGYTIDKNRNWEVIPEEAEVIRWIAEEFLDGKVYNEIIEKLHVKGIKSPTGKDFWNDSQIREMLRSEKYKGDYLFQKSYRPDFLSGKSKRNNGEITQYYIEKHHPGIIEAEEWDLIQEEMERRSRAPVDEAKALRTAGRNSFYKSFYCSECGGVVTRYRSKSRCRDGAIWRCFETFAAYSDVCSNKIGVRQEYIEFNFMKMLQEIDKRDGFKKLVEQEIDKLKLTPNELLHEEKIEKEIEGLNKLLYEVVDEELSRRGQDTKTVDFLTEKIINLKSRLKEFEDRKEKAKYYKAELNELLRECKKLKPLNVRDFNNMDVRIKPGDSIYDTTKNAKDCTYVRKDGADHFRDDIFKKFITKGGIDNKGRIKYTFIFGIDYGVEMVYEEYLEAFEKVKEEINKEELLNSKEATELTEYCKVAKSSKEMKEFLKIESPNSFYKRILNPLVEVGKLRKTRPDSTSSHKQKYYSVE